MLSLGFDDVIGKPFELPKLLDMVARLLELEVSAAAVPDAAEAPAPAAERVALTYERSMALSNAIQEALELGDIGELTTLGEALEAEGGSAATAGARLRALGEAFDFEGLARLNAELMAERSKGESL
jgi:hypothetical protein